MKETAFISDLHLDASRPAAVKLLERFLDRSEGRLGALYVLGDLFEYWIGDDHQTPLADQVAAAFSKLWSTGTDLYFVAGNRDFLLGPAYAARCGMRILTDPCVILLDGSPTVISHGDRFCVDDVDYQAFRCKVQDPLWMRAFLDKPLHERLAFADDARAESRRRTGEKADAIMDVNHDSVRELMQHLGIKTLVHGHTHRPASHSRADEACRRLVLGDWYEDGEATIAVARPGGLELRTLGAYLA